MALPHDTSRTRFVQRCGTRAHCRGHGNASGRGQAVAPGHPKGGRGTEETRRTPGASPRPTGRVPGQGDGWRRARYCSSLARTPAKAYSTTYIRIQCIVIAENGIAVSATPPKRLRPAALPIW